MGKRGGAVPEGHDFIKKMVLCLWQPPLCLSENKQLQAYTFHNKSLTKGISQKK